MDYLIILLGTLLVVIIVYMLYTNYFSSTTQLSGEVDMKDNENEFDSTYIGPDTEKKKNLVKLRKIQKRHLK